MDDSILIVDDTSESLRLLTGILAAEGYHVRSADSGKLALASAFLHPPELILLDICMPEIDGYEVCKRLKEHEATRDVPVIFISAASEVDDRVAGLDLGAVDYITKPFHREELAARVRTHLDLARLRSRLDKLVLERTADLHAAVEQLRQSALFQRKFLRDVLGTVTGGTLILCHEASELPLRRTVSLDSLTVAAPVDLMAVRDAIRAAGVRLGLDAERVYDMLTGFHEAVMNALVHVGSGLAIISIDPAEGILQARIEDTGSGIAHECLPHAALLKGYTTSGTFGHGMKMMVSLVDHVWLLTGPSGTTLVLEQARERPEFPGFALPGGAVFPDTH